MRVSFSTLRLWSYETPTIIPNLFLGGSAPCLQHLTLRSISFPGLPKLLLSATHLVHLQLSVTHLPLSGYFSPEDIVASLSVLSSLRLLCLEFQSSQSRPDWGSRHPLPSKRSVLPARRSLQISFQRGYRIFGGTHGPYRHPSTPLREYNILQSNRF